MDELTQASRADEAARRVISRMADEDRQRSHLAGSVCRGVPVDSLRALADDGAQTRVELQDALACEPAAFRKALSRLRALGYVREVLILTEEGRQALAAFEEREAWRGERAEAHVAWKAAMRKRVLIEKSKP